MDPTSLARTLLQKLRPADWYGARSSRHAGALAALDGSRRAAGRRSAAMRSLSEAALPRMPNIHFARTATQPKNRGFPGASERRQGSISLIPVGWRTWSPTREQEVGALEQARGWCLARTIYGSLAERNSGL